MNRFMAMRVAGYIAVSAVVSVAPSSLADTSWGAQADTYLLNCSSPDCGGGGTFGAGSEFGPYNDNWQMASATSFVSNVLGTAEVFASFESVAPGLSTGVMTGELDSGPMGASQGAARTLDQYFYSGPATTITITATLTGTLVPPLSGANSTLDGIFGDLLLFSDPFSISEIDFEQSVDLACLGECYVPDDEVNLSITDTGSVLTGDMTLDLEDGDVFALWARLGMGAAGEGTASSPNSFRYSFSSTSGLTSLSGASGGDDSDGDGVDDDTDNCIDVANADQRDTDGDGYGNVCDADLNNDGIINAIDLGLFKAVFFTADDHADFNGDGVVNAIDLGVIKGSFFMAPGPSGLAP